MNPYITYECLKGFHGDCGADACNCACHAPDVDSMVLDDDEENEDIF